MITGRLKERIASCRSVAILTGAGVSAESGIATFRDPGGLWQQFKPEELANIDAFLRNPTLVQSWYAERRKTVDSAAPNPAHRALAALESVVRTTLITQNVDNLHQRAGSRNVVELHGNILRNYCIDCSAEASITGDDVSVGEQIACLHCGGLIRPDVVWFGEMLPPDAIRSAQTAAAECDIFLTVGTGAEVYPAAELPVIAANSGAYVVEMNIQPTNVTRLVNEVITGPVGETLPQLVDVFVESSRSIEARKFN